MHKTSFFFPSHFNLMVLPLETVLYKFWGFFFCSFQNFFEKQKIFSLCPGNKPIFGHVLHAYYTHELAWSGFKTFVKIAHSENHFMWILTFFGSFQFCCLQAFWSPCVPTGTIHKKHHLLLEAGGPRGLENYPAGTFDQAINTCYCCCRGLNIKLFPLRLWLKGKLDTTLSTAKALYYY